MHTTFSTLLQTYLASIGPDASHDARRIRFLGLLKGALALDLAQAEIEVPVPSPSGVGRRYRGEVDTLLGDLVVEFKRSLARELDDAHAQLKRYVSALHAQHPAGAFTAVATDGLRLIAYQPLYDDQGQVADLRPIGELDLAKEGLDASAAFLWLDALFNTYPSRRPATTQSILSGLGPASPAFQVARDALARLYDALGADPALALRFNQWQRYLALVYGDQSGDTGLFLKHTYLATVARLVAYLRLGAARLPSEADLAGVLNGDYFSDRASLANFVEEDFFTWPLLEPARKEGLALVRRLLHTLQGYDFSEVTEDVLKDLYQGLVDPEARHDLGEFYTPDWLAELILRDELGLQKDPHRSLLDPACGSGTFLFIAVRLIRQALEREGMAPSEILTHILENVVGVDVHPLAVAIARTNYLLALGDLLQAPRGDVTIPIYLADAIKLPETTQPLAAYPSAGLSPPLTTSVQAAGAKLPQLAQKNSSLSPNGREGQGVRSNLPRSAEGAAFAVGTGVSPESNKSPSPSGEGDQGGEVGSFAIEAGEKNVLLQIPYSLASDPVALDYLLPFMKRRYGESLVRTARNEAEQERGIAAYREFLIAPGNFRKRAVLTPEDAEVMVQTQRALVDLMRQGKDTLWFFILRNALRPVYLRQRTFDLVVGNPPWLSLRYIRGSQYYQWVRGQILDDYQILDRGKPHLFTQMELATLFIARAADLYLKQGGHIAFVMPRSVMGSGQQHARFTGMSFKRGGLLQLGLQKALDLEGVSPLFNVPACVLVAQKGKWPEWPVPGEVVSGDLLVKNTSLELARPKLTFQPTAYQRVDGRLTADAGGAAAQAPRGRSYYYDRFYQGATIVPRNLWFVHPVVTPLGFNREAPFFETDPEGVAQAKAPWKDLHMEGNVEARFLYATLPSGQLVPFGYTRLSPVILPLVNEGGRYALLNADGAQERGFYRLAEWLRAAQGIWEERSRKGTKGESRIANVFNRLDYQHGLIRQSTDKPFKVLHNRSGTNLCSAVIACNELPPDNTAHITFAGFVSDNGSHIFETANVLEAHYLCTVLNAKSLDDLIKPMQTVGQWGERDIYKRPFEFPIAQYDPQNAVHVRLAELGQACAARVAEAMPELAARYRSIGRLRGEVRRLLAAELAEIDALTRQALGMG